MRQSIFDRIGHKCETAMGGLSAAGMDYLVKRVPLVGAPGHPDAALKEVPKAFGLFTSKGEFLPGTVGDEYRCSQHQESAQTLDELEARKLLTLRTCGSLSAGTAFWWSDLAIQTEVRAGDPVRWGLLTLSSHGALSNKSMLVGERVRCTNIMPRLMRGKVAGLAITYRHSGDVAGKVEQTRGLLNAALAEARVEADIWQKLAERKISKADALAIIRKWVGADAQDLKDEKRAKLEADAMTVQRLVATSDGNVGDDSLWELMNGMTFFLDHQRKRHADAVKAAKRLAASAIDGVVAERRQRALELVVKAAA